MQRGSWDEIFARGMGQFVWRYGVVCFGGLFFLVNTPVRWLSINPDLHHDSGSVAALIVISFVYSISVGTALGIASWYGGRAVSRMTRRPESAAHEAPVVASMALLGRPKSHSAAANK